jgi:two-component system cell cycle sensor histidine kinase/response regulator CckA
MAEEQLETILIAEDVEPVLRLCASVLEKEHFVVLKATSGDNAIQVAANHSGNIDLLLSDVKMPGMSGPRLAETLQKARPHMQVMLMSGYTGTSLSVIDPGWAFIHKPFVPKKLVEMVNLILHPHGEGPHATFRMA